MDISKNRATADQLFVCRQMAGEVVLEQSSREVALEAGDITVLDPLLPYAGRFFSGSKLLVLKIPRRLFEARTGKTRQMIARRIRPTAAESSLASSFLAMLPTHAGNLGARGRGDRRGSGARPDCGVVCKGDGEQAACFIRAVACFGEPS